jgi:hypothetical protein
MNLKGIKRKWLGHSICRIETPGGKTIFIAVRDIRGADWNSRRIAETGAWR